MFRSLIFVLLLVTTTAAPGAPVHEFTAFAATGVHVSVSAGLII